MKSTFYTLMLSIVIIFSANAQEISCTMTKSSVFTDDYKYSEIVAVGQDSKGGVTIVRVNEAYSINAFRYTFEHYNDKLLRGKSVEYKMDGIDMLLDVSVRNDSVSMIEFEYDKELKSYICSASAASINDFKFTKRELFRLNVKRDYATIVGTPFSSQRADNDYAKLTYNADRSVFMIQVDVNSGDGKDNGEAHNVYVFNNKFELQWQNSYKDTFDRKDYSISSFDIAADGSTAYILGKAELKGKARKKDAASYYYELTRVDKAGATSKSFYLDNIYVEDLEVISKKDGLGCVGFYSTGNYIYRKGACFYGFDSATLEMRTPKITPFTTEFKARFGLGKDDQIKGVTLRSIILKQNDEIILNSEMYYETQHINERPVHRYGDIIVAKLNPDGDVLWIENVTKSQPVVVLTNFISFTALPVGDDVYYLANGNLKEYEGKFHISWQEERKTSDLSVVKIDKDGKIEFKKLMDKSQNTMPIQTTGGKLVPQSSPAYFLGIDGKKKQITRFIF